MPKNVPLVKQNVMNLEVFILGRQELITRERRDGEREKREDWEREQREYRDREKRHKRELI